MERLSAGITMAIKRNKVSISLEAADNKRNKVIRQPGTLLAGHSAIPIADKKAAADRLISVYDKYGNSIVNEAYAQEPSLIESMLEGFAAHLSLDGDVLLQFVFGERAFPDDECELRVVLLYMLIRPCELRGKVCLVAAQNLVRDFHRVEKGAGDFPLLDVLRLVVDARLSAPADDNQHGD